MARSAILQKLTQTALSGLRYIRLGEAIRRSRHRLPQSAQHWLRDVRLSARMRAGDSSIVLHELGSLVPEQELKRVFRDAWALLEQRGDGSDLGDYLEFGVYIGTSMACMHEVLVERALDNVRMFGFDSFEGLPADAHSDDTFGLAPWRAGDMRVPFALCRANLSQRGVDWDRTTLIKGFFDDTLTPDVARQHGIRKAGVIMVDSNLYSSAKTALEFCEPLIGDHAVVLFDDWMPHTLGAARTGERRAFEEFLAAHPDLAAEELESYLPEHAKVFLLSRLPLPSRSRPEDRIVAPTRASNGRPSSRDTRETVL
jgi:O-methyltransferase